MGQTSQPADYYQLLDISRSASAEEIKRAFRARAKENHPDKLRDLEERERQRRIETMYRINEAYKVLSNPETRREYDHKPTQEPRQNIEGSRSAPTASGTGMPGFGYYEDFFSQMFGEGGPLGSFFTDSPFDYMPAWGTVRPKPADYFLIPESDWGLLAALKKAYESKKDGQWRVKKSPEDKRTWMPPEVYLVDRVDGQISVLRVITDWRNDWDRKKEIEIFNEREIWKVGQKMAPDTFLGEYYLYGKGRNRIRDCHGIPYRFGEYLQALKSVAGKFARRELNAEGNYSLDELAQINALVESRPFYIKTKEMTLWASDEYREWARKVPFSEFWPRLAQAEDLVSYAERPQHPKENQTGAVKAENGAPNPPGEFKG